MLPSMQRSQNSFLASFHCRALRCNVPVRVVVPQALLTMMTPTNACGLQVPAAHVTRLDIIPDIDAGAVNITVLGSTEAEGAKAQVTVLDKEGHKVSLMPHASCQCFKLFPLLLSEGRDP
jgi:hypothetical protein